MTIDLETLGIEVGNVRARPRPLWNGCLALAAGQAIFVTWGLIPAVASLVQWGTLPWQFWLYLVVGLALAATIVAIDLTCQPGDELQVALKAALYRAPRPLLTKTDWTMGVLGLAGLGAAMATTFYWRSAWWEAQGGLFVGFYGGLTPLYVPYRRSWRLAREIVAEARRRREAGIAHAH